MLSNPNRSRVNTKRGVRLTIRRHNNSDDTHRGILSPGSIKLTAERGPHSSQDSTRSVKSQPGDVYFGRCSVTCLRRKSKGVMLSHLSLLRLVVGALT